MPNGLHTLLKMNSLNIISSRVSPSSSPAPSRSNSLGSLGIAVHTELDRGSHGEDGGSGDKLGDEKEGENEDNKHGRANRRDVADEYSPLLGECKEVGIKSTAFHRRITVSLINSLRWIFTTLAAPGVYIFSFFYDENGRFSPLLPLRRLFGRYEINPRKLESSYPEEAVEEKLPAAVEMLEPGYDRTSGGRRTRSSSTSSSGLSSESESDAARGSASGKPKGQLSRHPRSKSLAASEEIAPARRSIRIKLHNDEALRQRRHRKSQLSASKAAQGHGATPDISAQLKSPTSPVGALTKYPKTPAPPRPLIPRRQPSYLNLNLVEPSPKNQKTLILDLDETLIHSMSKGGRMSTGHMVEVRLNTTLVGAGGQTSVGPQHPILYYVHKRPYCDDFLRRVAKWYKLVIFTASVQEYADPVIDWLEQEKKFFSGRYYRQHCTFRQGAFIKDLSSVEPDLSKVMILDNSPLSYLFHQDNAIPIQGWINDPTDNDLLHLVPFLEGLQYVTDVRALLALRGGEDGQHMA